MKLTMRDIAAQAKVSPATVSNALNGRPGVSDSVKEHILTIAREMGYQSAREAGKSNRYVRLIIYRSHGIVVADTPFFSELIESIQSECHQEGLELMISHVHAQEDSDFEAQIHAFCNEKCAGIILLATEMSPEELGRFTDLRSPMVVLDNSFASENVHSVVMNNWEAGYLAAKELLSAGHRDIGHITSSVAFRNNSERTAGFRAGLAEAGLELPEEKIFPVLPAMNGAYEDMKRLIAERGGRLPGAFFAGNDWMAIGSMRAIKEAGYRVPEDVSIVGMDDTAICEACTPQLTTVHVYRRELGMTVIRTLLSVIHQGTPCAIKTTVGVKIVPRGSVKNLRARGD